MPVTCDSSGYGIAYKPIEPIVFCGRITVGDDFRRLADYWTRETGMLSSISKRVQHPAYQEIIDMGEIALPMILSELRDRPDHWFSALRAIAKETPVADSDSSDPVRARAAWLKWGKEKGFID